MIIVIQCAASKQSDAGHLITSDGKSVKFVAQPELAPSVTSFMYARPDDQSDENISWRQILLRYNEERQDNHLGLYPAYQLYENKTYERLVNQFGLEKVYILSAGWGLITSEFLTPYYDITYSQSAEKYKKRNKREHYDDFQMIPEDIEEEIVFFGGKDYLPLFCSLTRAIKSKKTVFYNSSRSPDVSGCTLRRYETTTRTNWHYECANAFIDGRITTA